MKHFLLFGALSVSSLIATFSNEARAESRREPVDYVNPRIGSLGHLLTGTSTTVQWPFGMVRIVPNTAGGPERLFATKITGFPAGGLTLMPVSGPVEAATANSASEFDRDFEVATPYYGSEVLDKYGITAEFTVAPRAVFYQFSFPANQFAHVLLLAGGGEITASGSDTVIGSSGGGGTRSYFYAVFSKPFGLSQNFRTQAGGNRGAAGGGGGSANLTLDFAPKAGEKISVRVGTSYISMAEARDNLLADIPKPKFDTAKAAARAAWNHELRKLAVTGGTEKQRVIFYTALYRSLCRQPNLTEAGDQYFSGYDHKVHSGEMIDFYPDDAYWDTYHCEHPLQLLLDPQRQLDMVRSAVKMY